MRVIGVIHTVNLKNKLIGIKGIGRINFYYFQASQMNLFSRYLYKGNWIQFECDENRIMKRGGIEAKLVSFVYKIATLNKKSKRIFYDKKFLNESLSNFFKSLNNIMFLDLEMTMPSYEFHGKGFKTELIQAGLIIKNGNGEELYRYSNYVFPKLTKHLSKRAENFLSITNDEFNLKAISYKEFYEEFSNILEEYDPVIAVYGKNDIIVLNDSYDINGFPSLANKTRFINLCQLLKNHYDLRNDPGLFRLYKTFYGDIDEQMHDAFTDAEVTSLVYQAFKDDVSGKTNKFQLIREEFD